MNSRYKFRGKRVDNGEWVEGCLFQYKYSNKIYIVLNEYSAEELQYEPRLFSGVAWKEVIPESVGQYTGLKDKNGVDICDRDIIALESHHPAYQHTQTYAVIEWVECFLAYMAREFIVPAHPNGKILTRLAHYNSNEIEIIGNATDNPELLTEKSHA